MITHEPIYHSTLKASRCTLTHLYILYLKYYIPENSFHYVARQYFLTIPTLLISTHTTTYLPDATHSYAMPNIVPDGL